jgi:aldehyde dehydrogenase (NAD+)
MMTTVLEQETSKRQTMETAVGRLRASFDSGRTRPLEYRQEQLAGLARMLKERESEFENAIHQDLGRPSLEIYASEIALIASELALTRKKLRSWTRPQRVPTALVAQPGKSRIYHDPLGVVLIILYWRRWWGRSPPATARSSSPARSSRRSVASWRPGCPSMSILNASR